MTAYVDLYDGTLICCHRYCGYQIKPDQPMIDAGVIWAEEKAKKMAAHTKEKFCDLSDVFKRAAEKHLVNGKKPECSSEKNKMETKGSDETRRAREIIAKRLYEDEIFYLGCEASIAKTVYANVPDGMTLAHSVCEKIARKLIDLFFFSLIRNRKNEEADQ
jgi:hypothetical protein